MTCTPNTDRACPVGISCFTPEQQAQFDENERRWNLGIDAGLAGLAKPDGASDMAYLAGVARRRAAASEIIGFVCQISKCSSCGAQNWGWRLGCSCWPRDSLQPEGLSMIYGAQVEAGSDPADPASTFLTLESIIELVKGGREIRDVMSGATVPVEGIN